MKVIVYSPNSKFILNNIAVPDEIFSDIHPFKRQYPSFPITATRGLFEDNEYSFLENEYFYDEIVEGIKWKIETVH